MKVTNTCAAAVVLKGWEGFNLPTSSVPRNHSICDSKWAWLMAMRKSVIAQAGLDTFLSALKGAELKLGDVFIVRHPWSGFGVKQADQEYTYRVWIQQVKGYPEFETRLLAPTRPDRLPISQINTYKVNELIANGWPIEVDYKHPEYAATPA